MIYLEHNLESLKSRTRDVSKIRCINCGKTYTYSTRNNRPIQDKLKDEITERCSSIQQEQ